MAFRLFSGMVVSKSSIENFLQIRVNEIPHKILKFEYSSVKYHVKY